MGLTQEQIKELLGSEKKPTYPPRVQKGPLRYYDYPMICASRGCGCSTYMKVDYIPRCMTHAIRILNEMVDDLTERLKSAAHVI